MSIYYMEVLVTYLYIMICIFIIIDGHPIKTHILVGGLEHFLFSHILGIIIPTG